MNLLINCSVAGVCAVEEVIVAAAGGWVSDTLVPSVSTASRSYMSSILVRNNSPQETAWTICPWNNCRWLWTACFAGLGQSISSRCSSQVKTMFLLGSPDCKSLLLQAFAGGGSRPSMSWLCSAGSCLTAPRMMNTAFVATLCPGGWRLCRCGVHQVWDQDAFQASGGAGVLIPSECRSCLWRSFDCGAAMRAPN